MVNVRALPVFAETLTTRLALPFPAAGATVAQGRSLDAVHVHAALVVTVRGNVLSEAGRLSGACDT
jgi:hypothetical protein